MFKKILLTSILAVVSASSIAGTLSVDLYRGGNASSPRLDNVRDKDVTKYIGKNGKIWVKGKQEGISTFSAYPKDPKNQWKIAKGTSYSSNLYIYKESGDHWLIAPAKDMPLDDYLKHLGTLKSKFVKLK